MLLKLKLPMMLMATLALLSPAAALAEGAAQRSLSLQDCIAIALKHEIDVLVGENAVASARERETKAKADYYPQITVQDSELLATSGTVTGGRVTGVSMAATQNFYDGGLREAQVRGARAGVAQSAFGLERTKQTVTFNVTRDYFALLRTRRLAEVQDARVKYLEEQRGWVRMRVQVGDAAEADVLPVEAQLANARVDQLSARNAVCTAAVELQNTMGLSPQPEFSIQEVAEPAATETSPLEDYVLVALASRPEVQGTKAGVESARSSVESAKIALGPRLVVSGQFGQLVTKEGATSLTIRAAIVFDLFNGGRNRAAYDDARAGLSSAALRAAQLEKDIRAEVQEAYLNLTNAKERLEASTLSVKAAQKNFDAQEGRYKQGLAIPLDLLNAQLELVTAQSNAVQAGYDYYTSIAQLEYAIGKQGGFYEN